MNPIYSVMRTLFFLLLLAIAANSYSQDMVKVRAIDSLVNIINHSDLTVQNDSIVQDQPQLGLNMRTYVSGFLEGKELKKYINLVKASRTENGVATEMTTSNAFYFDKGQLIKVEEWGIGGTMGDQKITFDWYYADDKPLHYTLPSQNPEKAKRAPERANMLLTMGKGIIAQFSKL